jgi:hypothetical protein
MFPEILSMNNDTFNLEYSDSFSGALWMECNNEPYVTLEHAFHEVFVMLVIIKHVYLLFKKTLLQF